MGLGDLATSIYRKCKNESSNIKEVWEKFENDSAIDFLNKHLGCPLYSKNLESFTKDLNAIAYDEALELIRKLPGTSNHEKVFYMRFLS